MRSLAAFTGFVARRRRAWAVVLLALGLTGLVLSLPAPDPAAPDSSSGLPDSYESVQVERLVDELPSAGVEPALAVVSREDGQQLSDEDVQTVIERAREATADVVTPRTPPVGAVPPQTSPDGTVAVVLVPLPTSDDDIAVADTIDDLRAAFADGLPDGVQVQVTGGPAFVADLVDVFEGQDTKLLFFTAGVVAVLLLATYRSPILWLVPLAVVGAAEQITTSLIDLVLPRLGLATDGSTTGITSVLVFGAATDYALLLIARYREELRRTEDRFAAMRRALGRTAEPILASGGTVVLAVVTLTLATVESNRALGVAAAIGVTVAMLSALVVLPCALVLCGRRLFWPFVPAYGSPDTSGRVWGRLGDLVARRPKTVAVASVVFLAALAAGALGVDTGLSQTERFRVKPEAVSGAETLSKAFPAGTTEPLTVVSAAGAADAVAARAQDVGGVGSATVAERTADLARVEVVLTSEPGSQVSFDAVRDLRSALDDVPDADALVGGQVASDLDLREAQSRDRFVIIPLILLLVFVVLVVLLRALLAPVLLMLTVIASFVASLGASWWLFTGPLFGYPALDESVLLLAFLFLVALGVDYNIFLVTRAREEAARTGTRRGMLTALRVTGGVITSAGILLAAVFAVLGVLPLITLTQIGVIVCVGVLLDTLLVRTVLVPALAFTLGDRFWWPAPPGVTGERAPAPAEEEPHPVGR